MKDDDRDALIRKVVAEARRERAAMVRAATWTIFTVPHRVWSYRGAFLRALARAAEKQTAH